MSLILDALNRSDRERREAGGAPGLHSVHAATPERSEGAPGRPRYERWLLVLVVAILGADVLVGRWQDSARAPATEARPQNPASAAAPAGLPPAAEAVTGDRAGAAQVVAAAGSAAAGVAAAPAPATEVAGDPEVQALYRGKILAPRAPAPVPAESKAPSRAAQPVEEAAIDALLAQAQVAQATADSPYFAAPYITDLPADVRSRIPTLNYSEHRLGAAAGKHRVRINGLVLAAGQPLTSDLVLEGIYPEGIVLNFQGVSFRLEALNRWVNF